MAFKLNYKLGKRHKSESQFGVEIVDVEWTHADGPIEDTHTVPVSFDYRTNKITYEEEVSGTRDVILDQVYVKEGTPDSIVMQHLEEKRVRLAENLGIEA